MYRTFVLDGNIPFCIEITPGIEHWYYKLIAPAQIACNLRHGEECDKKYSRSKLICI